ncbi:MAG: ubiquinone/menaquinone biosynthesis methyltransferase [Geminicoccaceae bacterium]|nr:MAG: ubiquinone/menaquinone biosynthesis methyltransferase [Geminicoccaceae bacterium]
MGHRQPGSRLLADPSISVRTALPTSRNTAATASADTDALVRLGRTYGRRAVAPGEREARIRDVFQGIAPGYDVANDLMSFGLHRRWKARLAAAVATDGVVLDLAGGTGDVAARLRRRGLDVVNGDPSTAMLAVDRRRHGNQPAVALAAEALPFRDRSLGAVTLAFGLRNFTRPEAGLAEVHRVLRPGGRLHLLEFSTPDRWLRGLYRGASAWLLPLLGGVVTGRPGAYRYLAQSIQAFPDEAAVTAALRRAGFVVEHQQRLAFGIAVVHTALRPADSC